MELLLKLMVVEINVAPLNGMMVAEIEVDTIA